MSQPTYTCKAGCLKQHIDVDERGFCADCRSSPPAPPGDATAKPTPDEKTQIVWDIQKGMERDTDSPLDQAYESAAKIIFGIRARIAADAREADKKRIGELEDLCRRAKEELRLMRMKDTGAVYDVTIRGDLSNYFAALATPRPTAADGHKPE